jgi:hypothetical protein
MSSKLALITALFDQIVSFCEELSGIYPDDPDFSIVINAVKLARSTNPVLLSKTIRESLSKYDDHVLNRNEEFFLSSEFEEYSGGMDVIAKLRQYYKSMNDSSKENVWKYCTNIIRLSKACS